MRDGNKWRFIFDIKREVRVFIPALARISFALAGLKVNGVSPVLQESPRAGNFDG